ncbi:MAG: hypothetical protein WBK77_04190 [Alphaproteobacteria bacterium]
MKNLRKKTILFIAGFAAIVFLFLYFIFCIPKEEGKFIKEVESAFNNTNSNIVMIGDVTDFDWDTVCVFPSYNFFASPVLILGTSPRSKVFEDMYKYDYKIVENDIMTYWWPTFYAGFLFIKNGNVVKNLVYNTWGLRLTKDGVSSMYILKIKNKEINFLDEIGTLNDGCISSENAAFIYHHYQPSDPGQILVTNLKKEK